MLPHDENNHFLGWLIIILIILVSCVYYLYKITKKSGISFFLQTILNLLINCFDSKIGFS